MEPDDLPPRDEEPNEPDAADSIGELFGATLWLVLFVAIAGAIGYAVIHWM